MGSELEPRLLMKFESGVHGARLKFTQAPYQRYFFHFWGAGLLLLMFGFDLPVLVVPIALLLMFLPNLVSGSLDVEVGANVATLKGWYGAIPIPYGINLEHPVRMSWKSLHGEEDRSQWPIMKFYSKGTGRVLGRVEWWNVTFASRDSEYTFYGVHSTDFELAEMCELFLRAQSLLSDKQGLGESEIPDALRAVVGAQKDLVDRQ